MVLLFILVVQKEPSISFVRKANSGKILRKKWIKNSNVKKSRKSETVTKFPLFFLPLYVFVQILQFLNRGEGYLYLFSVVK